MINRRLAVASSACFRLAVAAALALLACGQETGRTPKEVLDPRAYDALTKYPLDQLLDRMDAFEKRSAQKLDAIQQQHMYLSEQQRVILDQLKLLQEIRAQVIADSQRLTALDVRVTGDEAQFRRHEDSQIGDPRAIAVLEEKVNGIARVGIWLLCGVGSLILTAVGILLRRLYSGAVVVIRQKERHRVARVKGE